MIERFVREPTPRIIIAHRSAQSEVQFMVVSACFCEVSMIP